MDTSHENRERVSHAHLPRVVIVGGGEIARTRTYSRLSSPRGSDDPRHRSNFSQLLTAIMVTVIASSKYSVTLNPQEYPYQFSTRYAERPAAGPYEWSCAVSSAAADCAGTARFSGVEERPAAISDTAFTWA
jgi:hypothetical protein